MTRLSDYDTSTRTKAKLLHSTRITPENADEVRHLTFQINHSMQLKAGQSIGVLAPPPEEHHHGQDVHFRLYTVAGAEPDENGQKLELAVRRCFYIDEFSGEEYKGVASHYLCDLVPGQEITISGPHGHPFLIPENNTTPLLMIGLGTGIAPFRAFIKRIYDEFGEYKGQVRLFYGARTGMELLYMNDERNDLQNYYDQSSFRAFQAVAPQPYLNQDAPIDRLLEENQNDAYDLIQNPQTRVYVAGIEKIRDAMDRAFSKMAGSMEEWQKLKGELMSGGRWHELIY